jgi:hypothetical protein
MIGSITRHIASSSLGPAALTITVLAIFLTIRIKLQPIWNSPPDEIASPGQQFKQDRSLALLYRLDKLSALLATAFLAACPSC